MRTPDRSTTRSRRACGAVLGAGILCLAGCATGYNFVQPDMAGSGSYYTGDGPYAGQGYYDDYATGPYYPGTSGWGYYNGTYSYPFGWYGGYGYGPSLGFNLGISNVWSFPGYWGPWYSTGCYGGYGCGWRHHHHRNRNPHGNAGEPQPWLKPDHPPVPPRIAAGDSGAAPPVALPIRPMVRRPVEGFANRRPLGVEAAVPGDFVRAPIRRPVEVGLDRTSMRPAYMPRVPAESAFANRREMPAMAAPRAPQPITRPVFRSQPPPPAPVRSPPPRNSRTPQTKVQ